MTQESFNGLKHVLVETHPDPLMADEVTENVFNSRRLVVFQYGVGWLQFVHNVIFSETS